MVTLTAEEKKILEDKNFAFIATVNKDGSPQVTPTWVHTDGKYVHVNVNTSRLKYRNLSRDARVAVALIDQNDPYTKLFVKGKVVSMEKGKAADDSIDQLSIKYTGHKYGNRQPGEQRVLMKIEPSKVTLG